MKRDEQKYLVGVEGRTWSWLWGHGDLMGAASNEQALLCAGSFLSSILECPFGSFLLIIKLIRQPGHVL